MSGLSVFGKHRFVVIVGEWIIEPGFDDPLGGLGRVVGGIDPDASLPSSKVIQYALDDVGFVNEHHNSHLVLAVRAQERVRLPDLLDEFAQLLRRDPAGLGLGDIRNCWFLINSATPPSQNIFT